MATYEELSIEEWENKKKELQNQLNEKHNQVSNIIEEKQKNNPFITHNFYIQISSYFNEIIFKHIKNKDISIAFYPDIRKSSIDNIIWKIEDSVSFGSHSGWKFDNEEERSKYIDECIEYLSMQIEKMEALKCIDDLNKVINEYYQWYKETLICYFEECRTLEKEIQDIDNKIKQIQQTDTSIKAIEWFKTNINKSILLHAGKYFAYKGTYIDNFEIQETKKVGEEIKYAIYYNRMRKWLDKDSLVSLYKAVHRMIYDYKIEWIQETRMKHYFKYRNDDWTEGYKKEITEEVFKEARGKILFNF